MALTRRYAKVLSVTMPIHTLLLFGADSASKSLIWARWLNRAQREGDTCRAGRVEDRPTR